MARKGTRKKASGQGGIPARPSAWSSSLPPWVTGLFADKGWGRWLFIALVLWLLLAVLYPGPMFRAEVFQSSDSSNADAFERAGDAVLTDTLPPGTSTMVIPSAL